jgi:branched-chain amino acid transport system substrate-binding protein
MKKVAVLLALVAAALGAVAAAFAGNSSSSAPASPSAAGKQLISCGKTRTIGFILPITGPAASIGSQQNRWVKYYVSTYNKTHKKKFKLHSGDTQLGNGVSFAVSAADSVVADSKVLGLVGPSGSNEVKATTASIKGAGAAFISGSATNTTITTDGTRTGFFFRTVPPDAQQGKDVATFIITHLKSKRVYIIDDQEAYSTGLADVVEGRLKSAHVVTKRDGVNQSQSDFSSVIAKIPRNYQLIYIPWQLASRAKAFGQQLKSAGKGNIALMGSDGLYDTQFSGLGSNVYDSMFPVAPSNKILAAYKKKHGGNGDYFGAPSYEAAHVLGTAIDRACKNGKATRAEVRGLVKRTSFRTSLLGLPIKFDRNGDIQRKKFGIYKSKNGKFVPIA